MYKISTFLKRLIGGILMKAAYWTAFGAMLIPVGVAVLLGEPQRGDVAFWLIVAGFASFIAGWVYTIREEQRQKRDELRRQRGEKERQEKHEVDMRVGKTYVLILTHIAEALGVDVNKIIKEQKEMLDGN